MCADVLYKSIKLYIVRGADSCCHSHSLPGTVNYESTERSHPTERKSKLRQGRKCIKCIWRAGGGDFQDKCRWHFLFWPNSDESKKCLILFYLFTLWQRDFHAVHYIFIEGERGDCTLVLCSLAIVMSCMDPSLRIVTKSVLRQNVASHNVYVT